MALNFNNITETFLHSKMDTVDNIEVKAIEQVISIAIKMAGAIDKGNLDDESFIFDEPMDDGEEKEKELELTFSKLSRR
jgi:tetrahydromethanopterin S-methyltransferase subunit A